MTNKIQQLAIQILKEAKSNDSTEASSAESPVQPAGIRARVKEIFCIHDNLPPFTKAEAVILDILSEEDELSLANIKRQLKVDGDIIEGCNPDSVLILLHRLQDKRLVTTRQQSGLAFFRPSEKGRILFKAWKNFGIQFLSELNS